MLGATMFVAISAAVGVWSMLHASHEVAVLRDSVLASTAAHGEKQIELSVGPVILGMARAGLNFIELDPEVRSALGTVRGTSVGVYRLDQPSSELVGAGMVDAVEQAMNRRGWDRILAVLDGQSCVLAYAPARISSPRDLRICMLVLDGEQLVVTSVRVNPEPAIEFLLREADKARRGQGFHARGG
jgi:hypothetical protein